MWIQGNITYSNHQLTQTVHVLLKSIIKHKSYINV